ncbi:MAG: biotin carboxylase N-terminal domain-containing protein, partial [Burkholderiaceae bacterium]|nr:biotin carboxylase N-terminal domain-containing protein [Burkholderiaceae bacterium]
HVSVCDEAVYIGASAPKDSYLRWQNIIAAAQATGAQAIHPGYGFLSENEEFARACGDAGLVFIGPPSSAILAMGLKAESKRLMGLAGVPLVPGYHGADQDPALLQREADAIGYPVLIKASAGGGGKGMRVVANAADFASALASCRREAINSFGNDAVLLEKYVQRPRHIEIQVFGDTLGNYVYLFERDCSVQRRHQKVLEEAPAPGMTADFRKQMGEAAVAAARAVDYVGAGTVEFIVEQLDHNDESDTAGPPQGGAVPSGGSAAHAVASVGAMRFFFMEMNTRLQVEHPVTEAITGQDLVEWQLRVASGEPLPLAQEQLKITGHAIEARICAENPDNTFLPATGTLHVYGLPECVTFARNSGGVRVDSGVREGDPISPFYDSMVAKLIVHGETREQALSRLDTALAQTHIVGLNTNVQFLRNVVQSRSFAQADLDTGLIPREEAVLFKQEKVGLSLAVASAIAHTLLQEKAAEAQVAQRAVWLDPWARQDGWRSHGPSTRRFDYAFQDVVHVVHMTTLHDGALQLDVAGEVGTFAFAPVIHGFDVRFGERRQIVNVYTNGAVAHVFTAQGATQIIAIDALAHAGDALVEGGRLTAPMPGKVVSFAVKAGDKVTRGQALAVMDAMKMEHTIAAPMDGVVAELLYAPGDQVTEGAELLKLVAQ